MVKKAFWINSQKTKKDSDQLCALLDAGSGFSEMGLKKCTFVLKKSQLRN